MTLSDDELMKLLQEVEAKEQRVREAVAEAEEEAEAAAPPVREGDPCPSCGEPATDLAPCSMCGFEGCLPRDDWMPGHADPCLTRCARCGLHVHVTCAYANEAGNPVCCGPRAEDAFDMDA